MNIPQSLKTLLWWPFSALFCASGAHVLTYAARRFSKNTLTDSPERVLAVNFNKGFAAAHDVAAMPQWGNLLTQAAM
jgi:hypothetical protein